MEKNHNHMHEQRRKKSTGQEQEEKRFHLSLPVVLLIIIIIFVLILASVVYKFQFGGIELTYDPNFEPEVSLDAEDITMLPLTTDMEGHTDDGKETILCLGNDVFSDDRNSDTSLVNMIADESDATVYNVSFPGTTVSLTIPGEDGTGTALDDYSFVKVAEAIQSGDYSTLSGNAASLGDDFTTSVETLQGIDFSTIDTLCIMYDASDYVNGRTLYNPTDANESQTGVTQEENHDFDEYTYMGAFIQGVQAIHQAYPYIRIVFNSYTYCQGFDANGTQTDGDTLNLGNGTLTDYYGRIILACESQNVTFLDDYNGFITPSNYKEYLTDNIHLNESARKYIAHHFAYIVYGNSEDTGEE